MSRILLYVVVVVVAWFGLNYLTLGNQSANAAFIVTALLGLVLNIGIVIGRGKGKKPSA